ncbi:uncharacterized protein [Watersipora subatra]|uniref:uncharacterized protein n=1 Tax=Watersipora subatra TaxID=2589382 RepID=UPI00355B2340
MPKRKLKKLKSSPSKKAKSSDPSGESGPSNRQDEGPSSSSTRDLSDSSYRSQLDDSPLSPSNTTSYSVDVYRVSYRLSTQESDDWFIDSLQDKTVGEVLTDVGEDYITYFECIGKIPPLSILCPMVKELQLENIPENCQLESLSSLTQLEMLWLSDNNFKEGLPEAVGALTSLAELYLGRCQLQDLPESLSSLTQLKELRLSVNNFKEGLPEVVGTLTSLTVLDLDRCQLQDLPESLSKLSQLEMLDISGNELKEVPEAVFHLTELKKLDISYNYELTKIDEKVMALNKLQMLNCDGCTKLISPPYTVCQDGIHAIQEYFKALNQGREIEVCNAPVAIVGNSLAGKPVS